LASPAAVTETGTACCCCPPPQASSEAPANLELVKALEQHSAFNIANPNNCYSLYLGFARSSVNFHAADGSGYEFIADAVIRVRCPPTSSATLTVCCCCCG
jgi:Domain of unknown function (DUF3458_C) ARM repeats